MQGLKKRVILRLAVLIGVALLGFTETNYGACIPASPSFENPDLPLHAYGRVIADSEAAEWHDTCYWGLGPHIANLDSWLESITPRIPFYLPFNDRRVRVATPFVYPWGEAHNALDFARPDGQEFSVLAAADGRVLWTGYHPTTGNVTILEHTPPKAPRYRTIYHKVERVKVKVGDRIRAGQQLGWVNSTLHFMVAQEADFSQANNQGIVKRWVLFDPFGLYNQDPNCYHNDDQNRGRRQHKSLFAPLAQDFAAVDPATFQKGMNYFSRFGFLPTTLSITEGGVNLFPEPGKDWKISGSFQLDPRKIEMIMRQSLDAFNATQRAKEKEGWRPEVIIPSVKQGDVARYTTVYLQGNTIPFQSRAKLTAEQFQQLFESNNKSGLMLRYFHPYVERGSLFFTGVWLKPTKMEAYGMRFDLSEEDFGFKNRQYQKAGLHLQQVVKYREPTSGEERYAGLWLPAYPMEELEVYLNLKGGNFPAIRDSMAQEGYVIRHINLFEDDYAVIFGRSTAREALETGLSELQPITRPELENRYPMLAELPVIPILHEKVEPPKGESPPPPPRPKKRITLKELQPVTPKRIWEGEDLVNYAQASIGKAIAQNMKGYGKMWHNDGQLLWINAKPGATLDLYFPAIDNGPYLVSVVFTKARQYGRCQISWEGQSVGPQLDGFSPRMAVSGKVLLGKVIVTDEELTLRITHHGNDDRANGQLIGIDYFEFIPAGTHQ